MRQRALIAMSLACNPDARAAEVSSRTEWGGRDRELQWLELSIRAEILNLILDLVGKLNVSFLYITHDLALARHMCDRLAVMYLGKIVEMGPVENIVYEPLHPYTNALIDAVPTSDPTVKRSKVVITGEIPSPINPPSGCRFHTRCPVVMEICRKKEPELIAIKSQHYVACHRHK